ncbi:hypothetical protein GFS60_07333 (plasmid) [Rhodococcus sp. WAY2]|nr:hypothetical protein GFS60_07333 [Rhodococcus sp. WAY2]
MDTSSGAAPARRHLCHSEATSCRGRSAPLTAADPDGKA